MLSLRLRLTLLVVGTALPLILFSAALVYFEHAADRRAASERVHEVARAIRLVLDRELQSHISALQVLALSHPLRDGNLAGFREQAETFVAEYPDSPNLSLADATGRQIINLRVPPGTALPMRADTSTLERVFKTGRPAVSNLYVGAVSQAPIVTVNVPAFRQGQVVYDISFTPSFQTFRRIIDQQRPGDDWVISIFDGTGTNIVRFPGGAQVVGQKASTTLLPHLLAEREGVRETVSLEGIPLITAYTRLQLSDWSVAVGMPTAALLAPLWRSLGGTIGIGLVLLALGLSFAIWLASQVARGEALQVLLVNEMGHRMKNTLALVQSIAGQTFRDTADPADARKKFDARIVALGRAHSALSEERLGSTGLRQIVEEVLEPIAAKDSGRIQLSGPYLRLSSRSGLLISLALHELATNAAKYGALSNETGRILIDWAPRDDAKGKFFSLRWRESGGPPVREVERKGFGSTLIEQVLTRQFGTKATLEFAATGLVCTLDCPCE